MKINTNHCFTVLAFAFCLFLFACTAHSPFIIANKTDSLPVTQTKYPAHNERVFITVQSLPSTIEFDLISTIDVGKFWYGSSADVYPSMADRAREIGANAIIQTRTWKQPTGFSLAAPHGSGQAVRVKDITALGSLGVKGNWY
jgi:hypothetical protein